MFYNRTIIIIGIIYQIKHLIDKFTPTLIVSIYHLTLVLRLNTHAMKQIDLQFQRNHQERNITCQVATSNKAGQRIMYLSHRRVISSMVISDAKRARVRIKDVSITTFPCALNIMNIPEKSI